MKLIFLQHYSSSFIFKIDWNPYSLELEFNRNGLVDRIDATKSEPKQEFRMQELGVL